MALKTIPQQGYQKYLQQLQLLKGSTLKMTPLGKLWVYRHECIKIIPGTS